MRKVGDIGFSTPLDLRGVLVKLFPDFAIESDAAATLSYHCIVMDLTSVIKAYLEAGAACDVRAFCEIVNRMVEAGGGQQNAIETCLLEHASQVGCKQHLKPHLGSAAKNVLR